MVNIDLAFPPLSLATKATISKHLSPYGFTAGYSPLNILMIGGGGVGSWIVPKLIKMFNDALLKAPFLSFVLTIIDGDDVSESNVVRQNFINQDVQKNKALVLSSRYSAICPSNAKIYYIPSFFASDYLAEKLSLSRDKFSSFNENPEILINCVDNNVSRADIYREFSEHSTIIDCGNNAYNGQVLVVPENTFHYADVLTIDDTDFVKIEDCSNMDVSEESIAQAQTFSANDFSATIAASIISNMVINPKIHRSKFEMPTNLLYKYVCGSNTEIVPSLSYKEVWSGLDTMDLTAEGPEGLGFKNPQAYLDDLISKYLEEKAKPETLAA